jgi:hypothetical protein
MIIVIIFSHIRNADGAILVYDISSESSFNQLDFWYESIKKATSDDIVIYLVGTILIYKSIWCSSMKTLEEFRKIELMSSRKNTI